MKPLLALLPIMSLILSGCSSNTGLNDSVVQLWGHGSVVTQSVVQPVSHGIVIGDGSLLISVIENDTQITGDFYVMLPGTGESQASLLVRDPVTGVTLLKLSGSTLQPAQIGGTYDLTVGQSVLVFGWHEGELRKNEASVVRVPEGEKMTFVAHLNGKVLEDGAWVKGPGAVVTDRDGRVIGLVGQVEDKSAFSMAAPVVVPPVITIEHALSLLVR